MEVLFFFLASSLISFNSSSLHKVFFSSSVAVSVVVRGLYMEVKTDMRKIMNEALRRVIPSPSDAPVFLVISKWRITMTNISIMSLKKKDGKVDSAVFKNVCNLSQRIHKLILKVAMRDHVVHKDVCSRSKIGKTIRVVSVV